MSSYYFSPYYPKGVRIDWEAGERVRVVYRTLDGRPRRRVGTIRRTGHLNALIEFRNQLICTWFRFEDLRKLNTPTSLNAC